MSSSRNIKGFDELQKKLKKLPEKVRKRRVHRILMVESRPLVWAARKVAYGGKSSKKNIYGKGKGTYYNLRNTIQAFKNKKSKNYYYVVIGLRATKKTPAGAYYAAWQDSGGTFTDKKGPRAGRSFTLPKKDFINKADKVYGEQVAAKTLRALDKEFERILNEVF